ncbi:MAG: lysostaphin resistance A-like protein [Anaerolineales bacterium]
MTELEPRPSPQRTFLQTIFLSPNEPRLRAGWRLAIHTIGYNLLLFCIALPASIPILLLGISPDNLLLNEAIALFAIAPSVFLARHFLDKRSLTSLGLKLDVWLPLDILAGILIAFLMMGLIFLIEWWLGWASFEGFAWQTDMVSTVIQNTLLYLGIFILVGWNEELLFRGYRLQNIAEGLTPVWGVLLSSLWFGIAHLANPNTEAKFFVATGIFLAGVFLAYGYISTKQLWLSIGLHIGWNFFEGVGFGFPVSGLDIYHLTRISVSGPELWTGGPFGPEAGLVLLPGLLLGAALIFIYARYIRESNSD